MSEVTLQTLADRVEELERKLSLGAVRTDWRSMVGIFPDDEFTRAWIAEMEAAREADRADARAQRPEDGA